MFWELKNWDLFYFLHKISQLLYFKLYPWLDLIPINLFFNFIWTFLTKTTNTSKASSLDLINMVQLYLEKSSTMTKTYFIHPLLWTFTSLHRGLVVLNFFCWLNKEVVYFPSTQASHTLVLDNCNLKTPWARSFKTNLLRRNKHGQVLCASSQHFHIENLDKWDHFLWLNSN